MLLGQLFQPFAYLAIRHPYKWIVDWLHPSIFAIATIAICLLGGPLSDLLKTGGFIAMVLSFVQSLPGFYIAALAAIATFGRADIDQILPDPTPIVMIKHRGKESPVELTRRRFLAMLFAFLTAESLLIIIFSIFLISYAQPLFSFTHESLAIGKIIGTLLISVYFLILYQMILATFWGLYYLGYKLHE